MNTSQRLEKLRKEDFARLEAEVQRKEENLEKLLATIERQKDALDYLAHILRTVAEDPFVRHLNCADEVAAWWEQISRG